MSKEFKVGILAVVAFALLYIGFRFLKGSEVFSNQNKYYVIYDDIGGLIVSNPVMLNGLAVGRVGEIKVLQDQNNKLLVTLDINDEIRIGKNTEAVLSGADLLGLSGMIVVLNIENTTDPLKSGDTLVAKYEKGITQLLKEKAVPFIEELDSIATKLNTILGGDTENNIQAAVADLRASVRSFKRIMQDNESNINAISNNMTRASASVASASDKLNPLMTKLDNFADSLNAAGIPKTLANAGKAVEDLQLILKRIENGEGTIGKLTSSDSLYNNLNHAATALDELLIDLRENPKRYVNISVFGRKDKSERKKNKN